MTYCTIEQARAAGAVGDDAAVSAAITDARWLIDAYTAAWWEPTAATIVVRVAPDGTALVPFVVQEVTAVTPVGAGAPEAMPPSSYLVLSSTTPGQVDAVIVGGGARADALVLGAEPWAGGWPGYLNRLGTGQVSLAGTFGADPTPVPVRNACATLAAGLTNTGAVGGATPAGVDTDDEGNVVSITVDATGGTTARGRTTGDARVDAALAPFIRSAALIN